jgi:4-amino-4-deoxy-L-arabinose transferase-like glycosyltransferase
MEETRRWAIFSAIFAGLAAATKYNGFLVLVLAWGWFLLVAQNQKPPFSFKEKIGYLLIALGMVLPWTLRNYFYAGNPLFPFFSEWVGNITPVEQYPFNPLIRRALLYGEGWSDFLTIPIRMFFQGQDDIPRYFDGVLNPIFLFLSPLALVGIRGGWRVRMAGFVILYFLLCLFLVDMRARYILPALAPLTVLSVFGLATLRSLPWGKVWVASALALLLLNFYYLQDFLGRADLALYLQGKEAKEEYLSRTLGDYDLWRYANRHLPVDAKVMMYFLGNRGYYCDREYIYDSYYSGKRLKQVLSRSPSAERLVEYFRELRITHIALREDLFYQFSEANLLSAEKEAWVVFRTRHLRLLYEGKGYQLYQVQGGLDASGV